MRFSKIFARAALALCLLAAAPSALAVTVAQSFTSATSGAVFTLRPSDTATYSVSGTFVGTVVLERSRNAGQTWAQAPGTLPITASASGSIANQTGQLEQYRFRATAYTSGTIVTSIADVADVLQEWRAKDGTLAFRIKDDGIETDGTLGRVFTSGTISAAPTSLGVHDSPDTAFSGDISNIRLGIRQYVTGTATLGQPTSGYLYTPEAAGIYGYLYNSSGWNNSTSAAIGRTAAPLMRARVFQAGQGDGVAFNGECFVNNTKASSTSFLANPACVISNGTATAGADGVYLNLTEYQAVDGGFDAAGIGFVTNLNRTNATGAKNAWWAGTRVQSIGSQPINVGYSLSGAADIGLDLSMATLTGSGTYTNAAITMKADQRIYGNVTATDASGLGRFPVGLSTTYLTYSSSLSAWHLLVNNTSALQVSAAAVTVPLSFKASQVASAVNLVEAIGATTGGSPGIRPSGEANTGFNISTLGSGQAFFYSDNFGGVQFNVGRTASSVNYLQAKGAASGSSPTLSAIGAGTDLDINAVPKGAGLLRVSNGMAFNAGTEPTCNSGNRGALVMVQGAGGVADTFRICTKDAADAYAYRALF